MRIRLVAISIMILLMGSLSAMGVETSGSLAYTDPSGDVENIGFTDSTPDNVDITSVSVDDTADPIVITLEVVGIVITDPNSTYAYNYMLYLDQTGDGSENANIMISTFSNIMVSEFSTTYNTSPDVSGNGTSALEIRFGVDDIGTDSHPIEDIYVETMVGNDHYSPTKTALDSVNSGFGDDGTSDDDDDNDSDNDGMDDSWENMYGLDTTRDDSMEDKDGDGYSNIEEFSMGTEPNNANSVPDYGDDDWDDDMIPDPLKEDPTDTSISVEIENVDFSMDKGDEMFTVEQSADGTTGGDVDHCSLTIVSYYDDGSYDAEDWTVGPEVQDRESFFGMTYETYFRGNGSGGEDDWSVWEMYAYIKAPLSMMDDVVSDDEDVENDSDNRTLTGAHLVIRAYSDENEEMWNQDSADIFKMYEKFLAGEDFHMSLDDDGSDDGSEGDSVLTWIILIVLVILAVLVLIASVSILIAYVVVAGKRKR